MRECFARLAPLNVSTTGPDLPTAVRAAGFSRRSMAWCVDALAAMPIAGVVMHLLAPPAHILPAFQLLQKQVQMRLWDAVANDIDFTRWLMTLANDAVIEAAARGLATQVLQSLFVFVLAFFVVSGVWHAWGETRGARGSPGKRLLGLEVVDANTGAGLTWQRAVVRHCAGTASWLSFNLGHLMAALPPLHAALHDRLTGTRVITRVPSSRS